MDFNFGAGIGGAAEAIGHWMDDNATAKMKMQLEEQSQLLADKLLSARQQAEFQRSISPEAIAANAKKVKAELLAKGEPDAVQAQAAISKAQRETPEEFASRMVAELKAKSTPEALTSQAAIAKATRESPAEFGARAAAEAAARLPYEQQLIQSKLEAELGPFAKGIGGATGTAGPAEAQITGEDYLKTLPKGVADQVKALSEGRLAFPSGFALKSPYWQQMISAVGQYDPKFDANDLQVRKKTREYMTSGQGGKSLNALNTAIGHAGNLLGQIGGTASTEGYPFATDFNKMVNWWNTHRGDPGVPVFKDTAGKLAEELTTVYRGAGGAEKDVVRALESLDESASYSTKREILRNAVDLLDSKITALGEQYNQGMGKSEDPLTLLNPHAQQTFQMLKNISDQKAAPAVTGRVHPEGIPTTADINKVTGEYRVPTGKDANGKTTYTYYDKDGNPK